MNTDFGECEQRGCDQPAIGYNDDGEALCEDHMFEWSVAELEQQEAGFFTDDP